MISEVGGEPAVNRRVTEPGQPAGGVSAEWYQKSRTLVAWLQNDWSGSVLILITTWSTSAAGLTQVRIGVRVLTVAPLGCHSTRRPAGRGITTATAQPLRAPTEPVGGVGVS